MPAAGATTAKIPAPIIAPRPMMTASTVLSVLARRLGVSAPVDGSSIEPLTLPRRSHRRLQGPRVRAASEHRAAFHYRRAVLAEGLGAAFHQQPVDAFGDGGIAVEGDDLALLEGLRRV